MFKITGTTLAIGAAAFLLWQHMKGKDGAPASDDQLGMPDDEYAATAPPDDLQPPPGEGAEGAAGINGAPYGGLRAPKALQTYYGHGGLSGLGACAACSAAARKPNPFWGGPAQVMSRAYYGGPSLS